ncbi:histone deacetylase complex subunit Rxt2 [Schizosaccharomyces japonicus yFS275]|uniref:Histone deacetylase complex subunit Rxt2 n=1 Tax=Schizosaccharomyces japonicus (strain yFS275 / FY16936) TaxID=402676 RepID=B6K770_SCHJY|nr:histone deacetylase complex subunit Rxt2 [Schizosaccharomyces japonicus yFS275]EEB09374.1 histone deacetylase complex subunit Rxt2 [Schizosaccharomyces japonicus yFS275]
MKQLEEQIERFKEVLFENSNASDSDSSIGEGLTNRGQKRKKRAKTAYFGCVGRSAGSGLDVDVYSIGDSKRSVISHYQKRKEPEWLDRDNPYRDINVSELVLPLSKPAQLLDNPDTMSIFKNDVLSQLAETAQQSIVNEHKYTVQLQQLFIALLGDDPNLTVSPNERFGITDEQRSTLLDIVRESLDKSREFVRSLTTIRMNLLRAERYKNKVLSYCRGGEETSEKEQDGNRENESNA